MKKQLWNRRTILRRGGLLALLGSVFGGGGTLATQAAQEHDATSDYFAKFFQKHYLRMTPEELDKAMERIVRQAKRDHGVDIKVSNDPPVEGVLFGMAINISRCKGVRKCVEACMAENNQSRDPSIQYIRVVEMDNGKLDLNNSDHYYEAEQVPRPGKFYLPMQCMQCENPPCVKNCPTKATWKELDGMVVVDYDWCIGCRYCLASCPYWGRRFNWSKPGIPSDEVNPFTHYLGNRPRPKGVAEKCTFCIQRTRKGATTACTAACPTGARIFGNLLDPHSEIRKVLEKKKVFRLKEELGTLPKIWYFFD
ncbi:MAG: 4Fe-4S dicluster domain-containing protein [Deltaproteobacteria bacterium]|nr:4Fe-4S dicluster domain-containing protein [Deltaproteobacteria bacterium]